MPPLKTYLAAALVIAGVPLSACSEEAQPLSPAQKQQMEQVVRDYLINNPEVIMEAINALQAREQAATEARQQDAMKVVENDLKNNPNDPSIGNPDGDVTMVEFFDYRCGFCKRVFGDVQTLLKEDGKIRLVLKEFPILGPESEYASRAAQAVWLHQKDKYPPFHTAMMENKGALGEEKVMELAQAAGVDTTALKDQMTDPRIAQTFEATAKQAQLLGISGTPAFVFGTQVQPGAMPLEMMKEMVGVVRAHP